MTKEKQKNNSVTFSFLIILLLFYLLPFALVLINSFKAKRDVIKNPLSFIGEEGFYGENYFLAMDRMNFGRVFLNSLIITAVSVVLIVLFSSMTAYFFTRHKWRINRIIFSIMITSMVIPFQVLMIPIVSIYGSMFHILNSRITLICMHVGFGASMGTFLFNGAIISSIPVELEEAARIDGCGKLKIYFRIVMPLLKPSVVTRVIIDSLAIWNDYLLPSLILAKKELYTLPIAAQSFHGDFSSDYGLMMAGMIMTVLPILLLYFVLQKHIIDGVVTGAVKG